MRLNGIFKDDMVFQRDEQIRIFGSSSKLGEGVKIEASIKDGDKILSSGTTDEILSDGSFLLLLPALPAGGPYEVEVTS